MFWLSECLLVTKRLMSRPEESQSVVMISVKFIGVRAALVLGLVSSPAHAFVVGFSASDFGTSPVFSMVSTFAFEIDIDAPLQAGLYSDPSITNIQYSVSGSLDTTPSGFPAFAFNLSDLPSLGSPISGGQFYGLNPSSVAGQTLRFEVMPSADLSDGLQVSELEDLGDGVVFRFNGREEGTGRYHPVFLELMSDGSGRIQNADNMGGDNPSDGSPDEIDVGFGEEYITDLSFNPSTLTIAIPEPSGGVLILLGGSLFLGVRRRGKEGM